MLCLRTDVMSLQPHDHVGVLFTLLFMEYSYLLIYWSTGGGQSSKTLVTSSCAEKAGTGGGGG